MQLSCVRPRQCNATSIRKSSNNESTRRGTTLRCSAWLGVRAAGMPLKTAAFTVGPFLEDYTFALATDAKLRGAQNPTVFILFLNECSRVVVSP